MSAPLLDRSLWSSPDALALLGSRCLACGAVDFPAGDSCPACAGVDVVEHELPTEGVVWTSTVQRFAPPSPPAPPVDPVHGHRPYALGYVDLGEVIVETRLIGRAPDDFPIGLPVRLCTEVLRGVDGPVVGFAFTPTEGGR